MALLSAMKRNCFPIAVDIGGEGARAVQMARRDDLALSAVARCRRSGLDSDGEPDSSWAAAWMEQCVREAPFRGRNCVSVLSPPDVTFHALELPQAVLTGAPEERANVVHWEVQRLLPDPDGEVETRSWSLPEVQAAGPNTMGVSAANTVIDRTLQACDKAGLHCMVVDASANALYRLGRALRPPSEHEVWGVLDLGARQTRLVLCVDGAPVLARTAGAGGRAWTQRIAESLSIHAKAAEVHKCAEGIARSARGLRDAGRGKVDSAPDAGVTNPGPPSAALGAIILSALRGDLNALANEIKRSYEYVLGCYRSYAAADLILVGGGAALRNLPEFLCDALGIRARRASDYLTDEACAIAAEGDAREGFDEVALAVGLSLED